MSKETLDADVIVVGAGNAACFGGLAARDAGARVIMLEAAPKEERGGNSTYTAGATRLVYNGVEDVRRWSTSRRPRSRTWTSAPTRQEQYFDDMYRMTRYRTDQELCDILVQNSPADVAVAAQAGREVPDVSQGRQAFKVDGKFKFWGGLCIETWGGGHGPDRHGARDLRQEGRRHPLRDGGRVAADGRRRSASSASRCATRAAPVRHQARRRRARVRRLRIERRDALPLHGPGLGAREGARHPLQHGRRHQHGARHRRHAAGPLVERATRSAGTSTRRRSAT